VLCASCRNELPETTPICPSCPPGGFAAAAAAPWAAGAAAPWASAAPAAVVARGEVSPPSPGTIAGVVPREPAPPPPAGPRTLTKKEKKARARERAAQLAAAPRVSALAEDLAAGPAPAAFTRPRGVTLLAALDLLLGAAAVALAGALYEGSAPAAFREGAWAPRIAGYAVFGAACLAAGVGLLRLHRVGRNTQLALCAAAVVIGGFSIVAAIPIFIYLVLPGVQLLFSGRPPSDLTTAERERLDHARKGEFLVWFALVVELASVLILFAVG
jgi:hypothetical protein